MWLKVLLFIILLFDNLLIQVLRYFLIKGSFCVLTESRDGKFFSLQDVEAWWSDEAGVMAAKETTRPPVSISKIIVSYFFRTTIWCIFLCIFEERGTAGGGTRLWWEIALNFHWSIFAMLYLHAIKSNYLCYRPRDCIIHDWPHVGRTETHCRPDVSHGPNFAQVCCRWIEQNHVKSVTASMSAICRCTHKGMVEYDYRSALLSQNVWRW